MSQSTLLSRLQDGGAPNYNHLFKERGGSNEGTTGQIEAMCQRMNANVATTE